MQSRVACHRRARAPPSRPTDAGHKFLAAALTTQRGLNMADLEALWGASGAGGLTVVIPLPDDVIQGLMKVKSDIEKHKNGEYRPLVNRRRARCHHHGAALLMHLFLLT